MKRETNTRLSSLTQKRDSYNSYSTVITGRGDSVPDTILHEIKCLEEILAGVQSAADLGTPYALEEAI